MKKLIVMCFAFLFSVGAQAAAVWTWEIQAPQTVNKGESIAFSATLTNDITSTENVRIGSLGWGGYPAFAGFNFIEPPYNPTDPLNPFYLFYNDLTPGQSHTFQLGTLTTSPSIVDGSYQIVFSLANYAINQTQSDIHVGLNAQGDSINISVSPATYLVAPLPASLWLLGSGLIGLIGLARRKAG